MKKVLSLALSLALVSSLSLMSPTVSAEKPGETISSQYNLGPGKVDLEKLDPELKAKLEKRYKEVDEYFVQIEEKEIAYTNINKRLQNNEKEISKNEQNRLKNEATQLYSEINNLKRNMQENIGVVEVNENDKINFVKTAAESTYNDVNLTVNMYYDEQVNQYILSGGWDWKNDNWFSDCSWGKCGGLDGIALHVLNKNIATFDEVLYTYSEPGEGFNKTSSISHDYSNYGLGMKFQDNQITRNWEYEYDSYSGRGRIWFEFSDGVPTGSIVSYTIGFGHTWDSTELNSIGISASSISFNFSKTENRWDDEANGNKRF
jgi:hypothetical protein